MDLLINFTVQERLQAESWSVLVLKAISTEHFRKKKGAFPEVYTILVNFEVLELLLDL